MRVGNLIAAALVALLVTSTAGATDYYACECSTGAETGCTAGVDTNAGTEAAPFKTLDELRQKFQDSGASCGDTYNMCRGGFWSIDETEPNDWSDSLDCRTDAEGGTGGNAHRKIKPYTASWGGSGKPILDYTDDSGALFNVGGAYAYSNTGLGTDWEDLDLRCSGCTTGANEEAATGFEPVSASISA